MKEWLSKLFSDDGSVSMMRVMTAYVIINVLGTWTICCIKKGDFIPIDYSTGALIVGVIIGKAVQSFAENK